MTPKFYSKVKKMLYISNVELIKFKFFFIYKVKCYSLENITFFRCYDFEIYSISTCFEN